MIETSNPEINVDQLMARICTEAACWPGLGFPNRVNGARMVSASPITLPRTPGEPALVNKSAYELEEFLGTHGEAFIRRAYRGILGREPDAGGFQGYLEQLRSGRATKLEILGKLRYSLEGREKAAKISGLLLPFVISIIGRVPVIGYGFRWLIALLRLPTVVHNLARFDEYAIERLEQTERLFNQGMEGCERVLVEQAIASTQTRALAEVLARIEAIEQQLKAPLSSVATQHHAVQQQTDLS